MDISILNIVIWILNFTFQFWNLFFKFKKPIWRKNWYLNSKLLLSILENSISIQKILIESRNQHFDFEYFYLNLKFDISVLNFLI
jgi:hypothetical protein